ncbi:MAG: Eco57I restriction-modification methylase domain-containing protein, partial [Propionibacteriaceae bacterium]|nr:Eco57I restriction-modification methylase domain-containing protein [Propionibacteriaceae bacterium]
MTAPRIRVTELVERKIYAWTTADIGKYRNWVKIGDTTRTAEERIKEQASQLIIDQSKLWDHPARFIDDGRYFTDHEFHRYLVRFKGRTREEGSEWFDYDPDVRASESDFQDFVFHKYDQAQVDDHAEYRLRAEQADAVGQTLAYFGSHPSGSQFLWNAKPRFGKTLTAYDLARRLDARQVLIITNRPAIANSWYDDFERFIAWQSDYRFVSTTDSLADRPSLTRDEFRAANKQDEQLRMIAFISLQDLKGSQSFGGDFAKLAWVAALHWDLLIIDEAHEGVDTFKTDQALRQIKTEASLYLSGTPFKAIANDKFAADQVFTWGYEDEQTAKRDWDYQRASHNPYEDLPVLNLYTYQLSTMMTDQVNQGAAIGDEEIPWFFDLGEFFAVKDSGQFEHEADVRIFLDRLTSNDKFPFSTQELRDELKHSFWLLDRVASAKALAKLLKEHPVFGEYEIVLAAGDGKKLLADDDLALAEADEYTANDKSLNKVRAAIADHDKTITLSVGQLTTGVTIPEWSAVLMLSSIKSPERYMQAAFRAQNPYQFTITGADGSATLIRKANAYVFDFAPERTLLLFDEFANDLRSGTSGRRGTVGDRQDNVRQLLNFLPVIAEDDQGRMELLDAAQVLAMPRHLKVTEVVRRGFMSNFLFSNIGNVFSAPGVVQSILEQVKPVKETKGSAKNGSLPHDIPGVDLDSHGNPEVTHEIIINRTDAIFGQKKIDSSQIVATAFGDVPLVDACKTDAIFGLPGDGDLGDQSKTAAIFQSTASIPTVSPAERRDRANEVATEVAQISAPSLDDLKSQFPKVSASDRDKVTATIHKQVFDQVHQVELSHDTELTRLRDQYRENLNCAATETELADEATRFQTNLNELLLRQRQELVDEVARFTEEARQSAIREQSQRALKREMAAIEVEVRDRLRGFSRTIPSFIMAYGSDPALVSAHGPLTLANFDAYVPDDVFREVTSISLEQFRFLRDGGPYVDEASGETKQFQGHLFDEPVFDQSINEFLALKQRLADYFDEAQTEDIFDYIPPQKTNQIFTPRGVVRRMVDTLAAEDPGVFTDLERRFIDLYCKSGLYLAEIIKRLNHGLVAAIPNRDERIRHIITRQVFGLAPAEIIYRIAREYLFGFMGGTDAPSILKGSVGMVPAGTTLTAAHQGHTTDTALGASAHASTDPALRSFGLAKHDLTPDAKRGAVSSQVALRQIYGDDVKFDVVIGNPPYQEMGVGEGDSRSNPPLYHLFVEAAKQLDPRIICLITPARWYTGGKGLDEFRKEMLADPHIAYLFDYLDSRDVFPNQDVSISGGVSFFLRDSYHCGQCQVTTIDHDTELTAMRQLGEHGDIFRTLFVTACIAGLVEECESDDESYCVGELFELSPVAGFDD